MLFSLLTFPLRLSRLQDYHDESVRNSTPRSVSKTKVRTEYALVNTLDPKLSGSAQSHQDVRDCSLRWGQYVGRLCLSGDASASTLANGGPEQCRGADVYDPT